MVVDQSGTVILGAEIIIHIDDNPFGEDSSLPIRMTSGSAGLLSSQPLVWVDNKLRQLTIVSFPSFGYLLAISPENLEETLSHFVATKITCQSVGYFTDDRKLKLKLGDETVPLIFSEPCVDAAFDVLHVGETVREEKIDGAGGAAA